MNASICYSRLLLIAVACIGLAGTAGGIDAEQTNESRYGAHIDEGWVHFVVFSPAADEVELVLFDQPHDTHPAHRIPMHKHGTDFRVKIRGDGIGANTLYMFSAKGANQASQNRPYAPMFNPNFYLSDPYAYQTTNVKYSAIFASTPHIDIDSPIYAGGGKSIVHDHALDQHPGNVLVERHDLIIYELHVQDYTALLSDLDPAQRGTYVGLAQRGLKTPGGLAAGLDHLVELGVTAVQLMPVMEYDEETGNAADRYNHWGYMTTNFFAPEVRYASDPSRNVVELKELVKALHDRGIAVFMDVVYNHTGEGSPWLADGRLAAKYYNFMGLCNSQVFWPTTNGRYYRNHSGTGNDVDFSGPDDTYTKRWATDSLSMWHQFYGIDGFRFDLARILADGSHNAADWVDNDMRFLESHLHAEPWDMGGVWLDFMDSHQFGHHNNRWAKWIGRYRDHIRHFSKSTLQDRNLFKRLIEGRGAVDGGAPASSKPWRSVNFLAVHDGYTLRDCVYFNDHSGSHNCWDSGGDEDLRRRRQKLLTGILFTSQGVPLILQGDEFGRTKSGALSQADAHNTYNYESVSGDEKINRVSWIDWRLKDGDNSESPGGPVYGGELFRWTKGLIELRKKWSHFRRPDFPEYDVQTSAGPGNDGRFTYTWEGSSDGPTQLAVTWWGQVGEPDLMVIYNEHHEPFSVNNLADWSNGDWKILARSWHNDGDDFGPLDNWLQNCPDAGGSIQIAGRSLAILISEND